MKNRRTETRLEVCLTGRWQKSSANYNLRITDLSESGCYVDTIGEVSSGERLSLKILLTNNEWLDVQGVVAHIFPQLGFGVRFVGLNEKQHQLIRSLINKTNSNQSESDSREASIPSDQIDFTSRGIM